VVGGLLAIGGTEPFSKSRDLWVVYSKSTSCRPQVLPPRLTKGLFMLPILQNQVLTMSSRELSKLTDKRHDNTLKLIGSLLDGGVLKNTTLSKYKNDQNGQSYPEYLCDKRDSLIIVARLSPEFTAAIVDRWQELENKQPENPLLQLASAVLTAQSIIADQSQKLLIAEPKAAALDLIAGSDDSRCIRDTAKELKIKPSTLTKHLIDNGWIYRQSRDDAKLGKVMAYQHRIDQGLIEHCSVVIEQKGQTKLATSVKITGKGFAKLSLAFSGATK
jgi:phage antirepressor YoqD-like protein